MLDRQTTILVIEDNPEDVETYKRLLEKSPEESFLFLSADSGKAGLDLYNNNVVDCILLDYYLPAADGLELLEKLTTKNIPVILLTGQGSEYIAVQALKKGAAD